MWNGSLQKKSRRTKQNRCVNAGLPELTIVSVPGSLFLSYNPYGDALFLSIVYTRNGNRYSKECKQLDRMRLLYERIIWTAITGTAFETSLTLEQVAEKADLSANYIGMVERGLKEPGLATIVKILNALNISADELLCDLVPSASHVTDDEISKRLEGLTPMQKKVALDLLDTYITNLPYLTKEE